MNVIVAAGENAGVISALNDSPWYVRLGVALLLAVSSLALRTVNNKREEPSTMLDMVVFVLAVGGLTLAFEGVFAGS